MHLQEVSAKLLGNPEAKINGYRSPGSSASVARLSCVLDWEGFMAGKASPETRGCGSKLSSWRCWSARLPGAGGL